MSVNKRGARVGAAVFVLGLSLAGPQAAGVAAADDSDPAAGSSAGAPSESSAPSRTAPTRGAKRVGEEAVTAVPGTGPGGRPARAQNPARTSDLTSVDSPSRNKRSNPSASLASPAPAAASAALPAAVPPMYSAVPNVVVPVSLPAAAAATATPRASATAAAVKRAPTGRQLPTLKSWLQNRRAGLGTAAPMAPERVAVITAAVNKFLTSTTNWLSALPSGPVSEFLQGAMLLVRKTLSTLLPGVGSDTTTGNTTTTSPYFTDQQMRDYLLGLAKEQYGGLFGKTVPYYNYGPYYKILDNVAVPDSSISSDTNTQVNGVDEADFVENDGRYLYVAQNGQLSIFDASSPKSSQTPASQTALSGNVVGEFLSGDRLTVITSTGGGWYGPMVRMAGPWYWNPQTTVTVFDVSDRSAPAVVTATVYDGAYRDARAVDGTVYLVMDRSLKLPEPAYTETTVDPGVVPEGALMSPQTADAAALKIRWDPNAPTTYRTYESWDSYVARVGPQITTLSLPHAYSLDADGNLVDLGVVAGPEEIVRPAGTDQQSLVTVVSLDTQKATGDSHFDDSVGALVYNSGTSIYMNRDALYVASNQDDYSEKGSSSQTRIDRFNVIGTELGWKASGVVPGAVTNQFAMDEQDGYLHVATHTWSWAWTPGTDGGGGTWTSRDDNGVYILDTAGNNLDITGSVTGLAPGEQLYATRFVGDKAYLITFVRTDPLHVIDLSDPTAPVQQGELVIPGFSNYLQPVGDGVLLGIGQERLTGSSGNQVQVSLFDVSDGSNPTQISRTYLDPGSQWSWSEAQFDHHALLYSPEDGLLVVPVSGSGYDSQTGTYHYGQTLQVLKVTAEGVQQVGVIQTDGTVIRTARIGDVLYAVSPDHVTAYNLADITPVSVQVSTA